EMMLLRAGADLRFLELREVADPAARTDAATRPQVAVWADLDVLGHFGLLDDARPHQAAWPDAAVDHLRVGADDGVLPDHCAALEHRPGLDPRVLSDLDARVDVRGGRIGDGHAGTHVPLGDRSTHEPLGSGQLNAVVDAHRQ